MPDSTHPVADLLKCYPPGTRALSLQGFNAAPDVPLIHASAGSAATVVYVGEACGIRPVAVIVPAEEYRRLTTKSSNVDRIFPHVYEGGVPYKAQIYWESSGPPYSAWPQSSPSKSAGESR